MTDTVNMVWADVGSICDELSADGGSFEVGVGFAHFVIPENGLTGFVPILWVNPEKLQEAERRVTEYLTGMNIAFLGIKTKVVLYTNPKDLETYLTDLLVKDPDFRAEMEAAVMRRSVQ